MAAQELRWLTYLLTDLGQRPRSPPVLYVNNKAAIALCQEHRMEHRTKHIALRYFLARELQQRGQLRLAHVASRANTADIFTKALPSGDHQRRVPFTKKQADLFFPAAFADDFPIAMQVRKLAFNAFNASPIPTLPNSAAEPPCSPPVFAHRPLPLSPLIQVSAKFGLVYVVTKLGLLFVYDLESATAIYRNRISPDPIFLAADAPSVGGVYAVNLRGKVLLATVNEQAIVPFVSGQLNSPELAISLARRMNLPGAENLVSRSSGRKDVVVAKKSAGSQSPAAAG
ncbi:unnamed protein product [Closterium sp. NIES-53]